MGDGILDGYPIIQDQTSPNLAHIPTTNLITYSNSNGLNFTFDNVSMTYNSIVSPDSLTNGILFEQTGSSASNSGYNYSLTTTNGTYSYSIFIKAKDSTSVRFYQSGSSTASQDFNPQTMISGVLSGGLDLNFKDVGNGWFKVSFTRTLSSAPHHRLQIYPDRNNTQKGVYIFGLQVEEQSQATAYIKSDGIAAVRKSSTTNLITYSEEISQYIKSNTTVIDNNTTSPDGTVNASKITKNGINANDRVKVDNLVISNTTNYSLSAFIKNDDIVNGGVSTIAARVTGGTLFRRGYEWGSSGLSFSNSYANGTRTNEILEDLGNGWYRIGFSFTSDGTQTDIELDVDRQNASDTTSLFAWGFQLEEQTQAETYAPTYGLPVTIDLFTENNYGTMTNMSSSDIIEDTPNN